MVVDGTQHTPRPGLLWGNQERPVPKPCLEMRARCGQEAGAPLGGGGRRGPAARRVLGSAVGGARQGLGGSVSFGPTDLEARGRGSGPLSRACSCPYWAASRTLSSLGQTQRVSQSDSLVWKLRGWRMTRPGGWR